MFNRQVSLAVQGQGGTVMPFGVGVVSAEFGDLGDNGDGVNDAFNTLVAGSDSAGHLIYQHEVVTLNTATADSAGAQVNASGQPITGTPVSQVPGASPGLTPLNLVGTSYRFIQVLAANSGVGMSTKMFYTYTTSTGPVHAGSR